MAKSWRNCKIIGGLASGNSFELLLTAKWMVNIAELWLCDEDDDNWQINVHNDDHYNDDPIAEWCYVAVGSVILFEDDRFQKCDALAELAHN